MRASPRSMSDAALFNVAGGRLRSFINDDGTRGGLPSEPYLPPHSVPCLTGAVSRLPCCRVAASLSVPFSPCPDLCRDVVQYCGTALAQRAGCSSTNGSSSTMPPAGMLPTIPPELLPLVQQLQTLPCVSSPFNNTLCTRADALSLV